MYESKIHWVEYISIDSFYDRVESSSKSIAEFFDWVEFTKFWVLFF